jgi:hypothetical protein
MDTETAPNARRAYTWRLTDDQLDQLGQLQGEARRARRRTVTRQEIVDALLDLTVSDPQARQAVLDRLA